MGRRQPAGFDAKAFLTKAGTGHTISPYRKKQVIFAQGDSADGVFYVERGQAEMAGTTRPRISGFMNKFRKLGFIEYNGGLHIHRTLLNVLLHG